MFVVSVRHLYGNQIYLHKVMYIFWGESVKLCLKLSLDGIQIIKKKNLRIICQELFILKALTNDVFLECMNQKYRCYKLYLFGLIDPCF